MTENGTKQGGGKDEEIIIKRDDKIIDVNSTSEGMDVSSASEGKKEFESGEKIK